MSAMIYYERDEYGNVTIEVEDDNVYQAAQVWMAVHDYVEESDDD